MAVVRFVADVERSHFGTGGIRGHGFDFEEISEFLGMAVVVIDTGFD